jgi:hypothetical protein
LFFLARNATFTCIGYSVPVEGRGPEYVTGRSSGLLRMAYHFKPEGARSIAAETVGMLVDGDGGRTHPYIADHIFANGREKGRRLADAVHFLASLHGRHPGVVELARTRPAPDAARAWLDGAADAFVEERACLTRIVVAAGPLPSTPGQAESEAAVAGQRHAIEMLAGSDRNGCALGAAVALVLDWRAVRAVIDAAAQRFGIVLAPPALPSLRQTYGVVDAIESPAVQRAVMFGAQQLLAQHRGLWDLLEARASARAAA